MKWIRNINLGQWFGIALFILCVVGIVRCAGVN